MVFSYTDLIPGDPLAERKTEKPTDVIRRFLRVFLGDSSDWNF